MLARVDGEWTNNTKKISQMFDLEEVEQTSGAPSGRRSGIASMSSDGQLHRPRMAVAGSGFKAGSLLNDNLPAAIPCQMRKLQPSAISVAIVRLHLNSAIVSWVRTSEALADIVSSPIYKFRLGLGRSESASKRCRDGNFLARTKQRVASRKFFATNVSV